MSGWFAKRPGAAPSANGTRPEGPDGLWVKCSKCERILFSRDYEKQLKVCAYCGHHARLSAPERIAMLVEPDSFHEWDAGLAAADPLAFPGYQNKLDRERERTGLLDAVLTGWGLIGAHPAAIGVTDSRFLAGAMNSVVGERITRSIERATERGWPLVLVSGTGGGASMFEGILSLMQMPKTSAALGRLDRSGGLYVTILTDPSMAGVLASWGSLGDVILAEPGAMIGFTGERVSRQAQVTHKPANFQTSEFQLEHGMIDKVVPRKELKATLETILAWSGSPQPVEAKNERIY